MIARNLRGRGQSRAYGRQKSGAVASLLPSNLMQCLRYRKSLQSLIRRQTDQLIETQLPRRISNAEQERTDNRTAMTGIRPPAHSISIRHAGRDALAPRQRGGGGSNRQRSQTGTPYSTHPRRIINRSRQQSRCALNWSTELSELPRAINFLTKPPYKPGDKPRFDKCCFGGALSAT